MVEDEADIPKFKDYQVSSSSPSGPAEEMAPAPSEPAPPKEKSEPPKAPESKPIRAEEASQKGDRIFASPLARKLAEDNKVRLLLFVIVYLYIG
jgi:pyruvate dehydrogenase E2 component (dihydrolipoamide acetyltransferase)